LCFFFFFLGCKSRTKVKYRATQENLLIVFLGLGLVLPRAMQLSFQNIPTSFVHRRARATGSCRTPISSSPMRGVGVAGCGARRSDLLRAWSGIMPALVDSSPAALTSPLSLTPLAAAVWLAQSRSNNSAGFLVTSWPASKRPF
jgi:hypothetical protein